MSFARWSEDSDVYVILHTGGYLACYWCDEAPRAACWAAATTAEMIAHLERHRVRGDLVPEHTFEQLRAEADESDAFIRSAAT